MGPIGRLLVTIGARVAGGGVTPDVPPMRGSEVQLSVRLSLIVVRPDSGERLDAAAGCEFLDDRLRLEEGALEAGDIATPGCSNESVEKTS